MEGPLNPQENLDPLGPDTNPFEDPMLDAVENNIENPPGFIDPLVESQQPFIDDLAMQLDAVEANIENTPPILPQPGPVEPPIEPRKDETDASQPESSIPTSPSTPDIDQSSEDSVEEEPGNYNLHGPGELERLFRQHRSGPTARPPRKPYGDGWRQGGHPRVGGSSRGRRTGTKGSGALGTVPTHVILLTKTNVTPARNTVTGLRVQMKNLESTGTIGSYNATTMTPRNS